MNWRWKCLGATELALLGSMLVAPVAGGNAAEEIVRHFEKNDIAVGEPARPPHGWVDFCARNKPECDTGQTQPRDMVLTPKARNDLAVINSWVNKNIRPVTDLDHWGVVDRWDYPNDGKGDCEDYVLLKRRMLIMAGWPRSALLITVVRDRDDMGHAVLTVKTDRGEAVLDNEERAILPWTKTGYRFVKRQSQSDQNAWVLIGSPPDPKLVGPAPPVSGRLKNPARVGVDDE